MKKKILITGSNGFLGRQFIRKFKIDYNILAIDNERSGKKRLSKKDRSGIKFKKIDILINNSGGPEPKLIINKHNMKKIYLLFL